MAIPPTSTLCIANCKSVSIFWDFAREPFRAISVQPTSWSHAIPARNESAGHGEVDRRRRDDPQSVPFSCRLEDATSSNTQQLQATSGNSQRAEVKAFKQQEATSSNSWQHVATRLAP